MRLILALAFWALVYAIVSNWHLLKDFSLNNFFVIIESLNGIHYHLHFLLSLIGVYIITPILKKIVDDENIFKYLLIIAIIFAIIIPTINTTFNYLNYIGGNNQFYQLYYSLTNWIFRINIPYVSGYLVFFLTGYKLFKDPIKHKKIIYLLGIISVIFTVLSATYVSIKYQSPVGAYYGYNMLNVYLMAIAVFVFFKEEISRIKFSTKIEKFIKLLSDCIFGIYLIHNVILIIISNMNWYPASLSHLIAVPFFTLITFIVSFVLVYLIRKIPKIHTYIT